jgi:recombination protein RecA
LKDSAEEVIDQLLGNKELGLFRGSSEEFDYGRIPFGIPALDRLTGGGIPKKRMTILYGQNNVGKSYLASQICKNVQLEGGVAGWIDTELSWDSEWMAKCGVDTDSILVAQPSTGEQAFAVARGMMQQGVGVIILDSIAGLVPTAVMEPEKTKKPEDEFAYNPMAWQARFINTSLPRLLPNLQSGSAFVAINQLRSGIGNVHLDTMPGGLAQTFFAHFLLQVRREGWLEDKTGGNKVGFDMEVRLRKTKVGGENWRSAIVPFRVEGGIDVMESYMRDALASNLISKSGSWYTYKDSRAQGMNGLKALLKENISLYDTLVAELEQEDAT